MWYKYLKIAFRNIIRRPLVASINIIGLTAGMASCILMSWYILDELSFDQFHQDVDQVYRINTYWGDEPENNIYATTPPPLFHRLKDQIPEIEYAARAFTWNQSTMRLPNDEKVFRETKIFIVDPEFLQVLDFNLIEGDAETAFQNENSLVITRKTALRYFGEAAVTNKTVIGKSILFGGDKSERVISAIVDPPSNTHFDFDMLVNINYGYGVFDKLDNWAWNIMHTYVKLRPLEHTKDLSGIQERLTKIAEDYGKPFMGVDSEAENQVFDYRLQPVTDIHLYSNFLREHKANSNVLYVQILTVICLIIALLACVNFANLSSAQYSLRAKEVGVRKLLGSGKASLITQFLAEALLFSAIAGFLALGIAELLRVPFNEITGKELEFDWFSHPVFSLSTILTFVFIGLIAGIYPAFYFARLKMSKAFKETSGTLKSKAFRNAMLVFQFAISTTLIICTLVISQQLDYIQNRSLGYDRDNVLIIQNDREIEEDWQTAKLELNRLPKVVSTSFATATPARTVTQVRDIKLPQSTQGSGMAWLQVDEDYVKTLDFSLIAGHNFRKGVDSDLQKGIIINQSAAQALGLDNPLGNELIKNEGANDEEKLRIIGVVKDYISESFTNDIKPVIWKYFQPGSASDFIAVKIAPGDLNETISSVQQVWNKFEPDNPFTYSFLDSDFDNLYKSEQRLGTVFSLFTTLAIFIAVLGLVGLVAFNAQSRIKEIGIRKVLGASVAQIILLLSRDFSKLIIIAYLIACPIAYWLAENWLQRFSFKIEVGFTVFAMAGLIAAAISILVMTLQSLRSANADPVQTLRND